mmetsp:Transcript_35867/g.100904  ORF Transcript_35867/g.100904 Transcript_35867/m.100904 type:complete len:267 (-) Transcript_35867:1366-2166(-)
MCQVVRVQNGALRGLAETVTPHQAEIHPRDGEYHCRGVRSRRDRPDCRGILHGFNGGVPRQVWQKLFVHADRAETRAAAAVGNAKRFVEVQVTAVRSNSRGGGQTALSIHVRAIHVDEATMLVHGVANFPDTLLEYAVGGGVRHYQARELRPELLAELTQVVHVDVSPGVGLDGLHAAAGNHHGRRIRAVRRGGDKEGLTVGVAAVLVVLSDHEQPSEFALRPRIGLQRTAREPRDVCQHALAVVEQALVTLDLRPGCKRVGVHEL